LEKHKRVKALGDGGMQQSSCSAEQRPPEGARTAPRTPRPCSTAGAVRLHLVALLPFGSVPAAPLLGTRMHCCPAVPPYLKRERDCRWLRSSNFTAAPSRRGDGEGTCFGGWISPPLPPRMTQCRWEVRSGLNPQLSNLVFSKRGSNNSL